MPVRLTGTPIVSWTTGADASGSFGATLFAGEEDFGGATEYELVMTGTRRRIGFAAPAPAAAGDAALGTAGGVVSFGTLSGGNQTRGIEMDGSGAT